MRRFLTTSGKKIVSFAGALSVLMLTTTAPRTDARTRRTFILSPRGNDMHPRVGKIYNLREMLLDVGVMMVIITGFCANSIIHSKFYRYGSFKVRIAE